MKTGKHFRIRFLPFETTLSVASGANLFDAIKKVGLPLKSTCGGKGTCGDCLVQVLSGEYQSRPSAALPEELRRQGFVLACQTEVTDHLTVQIPQFQEISVKSFLESRFLDENRDRISGVFEVHPAIRRISLQLPPQTLENHLSDLQRVQRALHQKVGIKEADCEYSVLKRLAQVVRENSGQVDVILLKSGHSWTILDLEPARPEKKLLGLACDVGTTTVALHLVDLETGIIMGAASSYNQQLKCGEDVISRINYAQKQARLEELQALIIATVNHLIDKAAGTIQADPSDIYYGSFSGNTTMVHLFLGLPPRYIREEPYAPTLSDVPWIAARELKLKMNPEARISFAPSVGSYVGGDITAGMLATPILRDSTKVSLFIDAGTNGELVIGNKDWLVTCACSAGPAFEGGGMKCGMPAADGAIEKLRIEGDGKINYTVIGGGRPKGLCGSGLIDLLAELFIHGTIDRNGKFHEDKMGRRLVLKGNGPGFLIEDAKNCYWGKDLILAERDIANLIRTKGAVFSACSVLLKNVGLTLDQIDAFYIAGGFGQHLDIENAVRIGLLPDLEREKFFYLGNTSLWGAHLILLADGNKELVRSIAKKMTYIELNTEPGYMHEYAGALFLPHTEIGLFPSVKKILAPGGGSY
jgi:uncharacterized 2Fe-2S/4Fe-4S cluster protein (DUF4445 family)